MSAKTTYIATDPTTGETVQRSSTREYAAALIVDIPGAPGYTIPAGTYWVATGKRAHQLRNGVRGYETVVHEDQQVSDIEPIKGVYSFHKDAEAAQKAGRSLLNQIAKIDRQTRETYGIEVDRSAASFQVVATTIA